MKVDFHPAALLELTEQALYYDAKRPGLGDDFNSAVENAARLIGAHPSAWPLARGRPRRLGVRSVVDGAVATIIAVAHNQRRPGYWRGRM